ncbi:MAG TPA: cysteine-rich CWC family protein [Tepidisphaeraceae bacterium]
MQKVCAVCAATFACGGPACWCARIQLTPESLRALREQYNGCLCPECLQKQARSSSPH